MIIRRIPQYLLILLILLLLLFPFLVVLSGRSSTYTSIDTAQPAPVAIVYGAGLTIDNQPSDALMDRLTVAADLVKHGLVDRILVSGDNRTATYNEPDVMKRTLVEMFDIDETIIFADYAGRRTYDTCRRAHELWGIDEAILVTQGYHLPRAIWTCEAIGIQSSGISATLQPYIKEIPFKIREIAAIYKALIDLSIIEPDYVAGDFIKDLDP